jgi:C1A family cysteine protease
MSKYAYGHLKDKPDHRDLLRLPRCSASQLPSSVDLRTVAKLPILDQGQLGSCTANAIASAHLFNQMKQTGGHDELGSRLALYYGERALEGTIFEDAGAQIRDGIKVLAKDGIPPERLWPYDVDNFTMAPPAEVTAEAIKHKAIRYSRIPGETIDQVSTLGIKEALAAGEVVVLGIDVYESFEAETTISTGLVPVPDTSKEKCLGGHAIILVGYDDAKQTFVLQNSWGDSVGDHGFFYLPYAFVDAALASDAWVIQSVLED